MPFNQSCASVFENEYIKLYVLPVCTYILPIFAHSYVKAIVNIIPYPNFHIDMHYLLLHCMPKSLKDSIVNWCILQWCKLCQLLSRQIQLRKKNKPIQFSLLKVAGSLHQQWRKWNENMPHVIDKKEAKGKCKGFYVCSFPQKSF